MKSFAFPWLDLSQSFKAHKWIFLCDSELTFIPTELTCWKTEQVYPENINLWLCSQYALTFHQFIHWQKAINSKYKHGLVPNEIPFFSHYFLLYYIMAVVKCSFQIPVQSFSGLSWSWSWMCNYAHIHWAPPSPPPQFEIGQSWSHPLRVSRQNILENEG